MRILLVGGTGLVGSAIYARLSAEGHKCILVSRHPDSAPPDADHIALDVSRTNTLRWRALLAGIDAVINAAGALHGREMRAFMLPVAWRSIWLAKVQASAE